MSENNNEIPVSDYDIFNNKLPNKLYMSKQIETIGYERNSDDEVVEIKRPIRIISNIMQLAEEHTFIKDGKEIALRITSGGKQQIVAKFYEDSRSMFLLQIQKFTTKSGMPHEVSFSFGSKEIQKLSNFINNVCLVPITDKLKAKIDDRFLEEINIPKNKLIEIISKDQDLIDEIVKSGISTREISNLAFRKKSLNIFNRFLTEPEFFDECKKKLGENKGDESLWQFFFEKNNWIFGYGLSYIFNTALDDKKLEQVVNGYDFNSSGKRVDALLKSRGLINSLCFAEIKTHKTKLVDKEYRSESYAITPELSGAIAQIQKTVQKSLENIKTKTAIKNDNGDLTGENLYLYQPKSFLVVGMLKEFQGEFGDNEDKLSSFELFRKNINNPEIITFDELYERARCIVDFEEK
jgi:hypothetical protein